MIKFFHILLLLLTCLLQASPLVASTNITFPSHTFSTQVTQKVESEEKAPVFHFARSGIEENIISYKTTTHFATTKQSPSFLKDAFQNFGVLHLEKSLAKSWGVSQYFSTKEKLGLVEHRAREVLEVFVQGAGNFAKLTSKSSLSPTLFNQLDNALASAPSIKFNYGTKTLQSPKQFLNEIGDDMYDLLFSNGGYAKFDKATGRMLYFDGTNQYFIRYTSGNSVSNIEQLMNTRITQLRNCLGLNGPQTIELTHGLGTVSTNSSKVTTFIGKTDQTLLLKEQFGNFKHIEVGEVPGGVNLLNMPDTYWNPATWFEDFNKDWMLRAINRGDDIYIASPINATTLLNETEAGVKYGSYYANELNELVKAGIKPKNITQTEWDALIPSIIDATSKKP